jgi:hypothetical protein
VTLDTGDTGRGASGLWNVNHLREEPTPSLLRLLEDYLTLVVLGVMPTLADLAITTRVTTRIGTR